MAAWGPTVGFSLAAFKVDFLVAAVAAVGEGFVVEIKAVLAAKVLVVAASMGQAARASVVAASMGLMALMAVVVYAVVSVVALVSAAAPVGAASVGPALEEKALEAARVLVEARANSRFAASFNKDNAAMGKIAVSFISLVE